MTLQSDIDKFDIMAICHFRQAITLTSENMKNTTSRHFEGEKDNESKLAEPFIPTCLTILSGVAWYAATNVTRC